MSDNVEAKYKRKRKKSFLKNARKYAKQGHYGRGSQLEADTYQYFVRIMEAYREGFDNDEDKATFVNNVFEQTVDQEVQCSCNQVGCRVVEMLLPFANDEVFQRYMKAFSADLRPLCSDRFASHVLEALVTQSCIKSLDKNYNPEAKEEYKQFALKISKFLLNNLEDFIWDSFGNHIIRTCVENLAQIPKEDPKNKNKDKEIKLEDVSNIPEEYLEVVKDLGERLLLWPQFLELCNSEKTSGFLQVLLRALNKIDPKLTKKYVKKLLNESFAPGTDEGQTEEMLKCLPGVFLTTPPIMILETCIQIADLKSFTQIYAKCFKGRLVRLAKTRSTNFCVQKLLSHCQEKEEFEAMFDELSEKLDEVLEAGHTGVILALGQGCKKLAAKQGTFMQSMMKILQCDTQEKESLFIICMARFQKHEASQKISTENLHKEKLNLHGTLILQLLLEFNKPIKIVNCLLNMDVKDLKNLFLNTMGSHIADSFVTSAFVGEKSREKLIRKMKGCYQELASTKFGSRSFEAIWNVAGTGHRISIMDELAYKDALWSNSDHGKIIAGKVNLPLFKRNKEEWKNALNSKHNDKKELLKEVFK